MKIDVDIFGRNVKTFSTKQNEPFTFILFINIRFIMNYHSHDHSHDHDHNPSPEEPQCS